ncbi:hypothetical protein NL676_037233 [Syzygium grande]|nr:hypothetical protein NL676_037233 [Syzygium grande]
MDSPTLDDELLTYVIVHSTTKSTPAPPPIHRCTMRRPRHVQPSAQMLPVPHASSSSKSRAICVHENDEEEKVSEMDSNEGESRSGGEQHPKQDEEENVARQEELKKSIDAKMALRRSNLNPERPDSSFLRTLDSSIKPICDAKLRSSDIQAVQICSLFHQRYKDFSPNLIQVLLKIFFPGKSVDDLDAERNLKAMKKHSTLKLLLELYFVGVIEDVLLGKGEFFWVLCLLDKKFTKSAMASTPGTLSPWKSNPGAPSPSPPPTAAVSGTLTSSAASSPIPPSTPNDAAAATPSNDDDKVVHIPWLEELRKLHTPSTGRRSNAMTYPSCPSSWRSVKDKRDAGEESDRQEALAREGSFGQARGALALALARAQGRRRCSELGQNRVKRRLQEKDVPSQRRLALVPPPLALAQGRRRLQELGKNRKRYGSAGRIAGPGCSFEELEEDMVPWWSGVARPEVRPLRVRLRRCATEAIAKITSYTSRLPRSRTTSGHVAPESVPMDQKVITMSLEEYTRYLEFQTSGSRIASASIAQLQQSSNYSSTSAFAALPSATWIIDSGAGAHMTGNRDLLMRKTISKGSVNGGIYQLDIISPASSLDIAPIVNSPSKPVSPVEDPPVEQVPPVADPLTETNTAEQPIALRKSYVCLQGSPSLYTFLQGFISEFVGFCG